MFFRVFKCSNLQNGASKLCQMCNICIDIISVESRAIFYFRRGNFNKKFLI